ncbi:MAG TPA: TonB-dependent receptor, partial [Candidatus Didemnitutus sp.]|nr:TonB-dependent receptor [Candidatus Didemnitutus sp.]
SAGSFPEITRKGLSIAWERELFAPNVKFYGDAFYQDVSQLDELAPYATGNFDTPGQTTIVIPARTPNPILTAAEIAGGGRTAAAGAYNPFNPFNQDIAGSSRIRLAEFGNRTFDTHNVAFAFTGGLRVNDIADKWNFDAVARYSTIENNVNNKLVSTSRFLRVLNAADPIFNPASSNYIGTTVPYNPFGYYKNDIPTNAATVGYATHFQRDQNTSTVVDGGVVLNTSELMPLPAGGVGFAIGADYRREAIMQSPDSTLQTGDILGSPPSSPIERQRKIASYFTEFEVPVFGEKHSVTGAHFLSFNLAARYEDFLTSSRHAFVPKIGVRWMPIDETLVVRASWGKSFREPSLYELYSGKTAGLTAVTDPVTGDFENEQNVTVTGNKNLKAEDGKSYNLGAVWSPRGAMEGFTFAVDAWQIERIGQVLANYQDAANRSATGDLEPGESVVRDPAGNLIQVNTIFRNVGTIKANGMDFSTSYIWKTETAGRFDIGANATWMNRFDYQTAPTLPSTNIVGQADPRATPGDDAILRWKGQAWIGWMFHGVNTRFTANYTDGFQDFDADGNPFMVDHTWFFDLQVSYIFYPSKSGQSRKWYSDTKLTVGATNIFDTDPPFASGGGGNTNGYPGFLYNDVGRFVYVGLEKKL